MKFAAKPVPGFAVLLASLALLCAPALFAQDDPGKEAEKLLDRIAKRPQKAWDYAFTLRQMAEGDDASQLVGVFEKGLEHESEAVRLVCARLVVSLGSPDLAWMTLTELLGSDDPAIVEPAAMLVADEGPEDEDLLDALREAWEDAEEMPAGPRVALCEALYLCTENPLALEQLREFLSSGEHDLVARAALALSELGETETAEGRMELLSRESGDLGRLARIGLEVQNINQAVEDLKSGVGKKTDPLVAAEIREIRAHFVDEQFDYKNEPLPLTAENLVDNACRAMAGSVDPFCDFLTPEELKKMREDQSGRYAGIGCFVAKAEDDDYIHVSQPIYSGPAYKEGMRSGDFIVAVLDSKGKRVDLKGAEVDDAVKYIKDEPGTDATVFVKRRGVEGELKFVVERAMIEVDTALEEMLPGKVGYVRLTRFGSNSTDDMKRALAGLAGQGMKGLILDLRDNPGGQLKTVIEIADEFLKRGSVISSVGGVWGEWKGRKPPYRARSGGSYTDIPMIVLINESSASGSEMLSGALKDNNRALVIGKPSYGKGIGQSFFSVPRDRTLKLTVFTYYLPSGISIDRKNGVGGVTPQIEVEPELLDPWQVYARNRLLKTQKLEDYLDRHYAGETKARLTELAHFDNREAARWPGFEEFYTGLGTKLSREDVRRELRYRLRVRVADDRGAEFTQNYQEDSQLLRAIRELLKKTDIDPATIPEYKSLLKE